MAYDLKDEDGLLDRGKVRDHLRRIIDHDFRPDEDELMTLIDEVVDQAWMDGHAF